MPQHITHVDPPEFACEEVEAAIREILKANHLLSLATADAEGNPHINEAYYAGDLGGLLIFTPPFTRHAANATARPEVAATVADGSQPWGSDLRGLQVFGVMEALRGPDAAAAYAAFTARFPALAAFTGDYARAEQMLPARFYRIRVSSYKVVDETHFGKQRAVTASLGPPRK
ncbi:MAG: pyridoxamine 5'-phosphate oxidase family protein [Acidimicrobiia bacterium]|nr:pyridoxamine 5'-phosphate oxidase family protein [Acidimicrobiia bacterium]